MALYVTRPTIKGPRLLSICKTVLGGIEQFKQVCMRRAIPCIHVDASGAAKRTHATCELCLWPPLSFLVFGHQVSYVPACSCAGVAGAIKNRLLSGVGSGATSLQVCHIGFVEVWVSSYVVFGITCWL